MTRKNILSPSSLYQDTVEFRKKLAAYINKYKHLHDVSKLEDALARMDQDIKRRRMEDNPEQWAYYGATRKEFNGIIHNGLKTVYDPDIGRGVLYTREPHIAWVMMGEGGNLLRFPSPMGGRRISPARETYAYDYFCDKPIHRKYIEVFLGDGDIDDPGSWVPSGALR